MNIETLFFFIKMAEFKNLSLVSKKYHISQSALSQQLSKLEKTLDTKLLNRSNKGVTLTPEGEVLLKHAKSIINNYDKLINDINNLKAEKNHLSIDAIESLSSTIMPSILGKLKKNFQYSNIKLNTVAAFSSLNLTNHICDVYLGYVNPEVLHDLVSYQIGTEEFVLISHKNFPKDSISKYDLPNIPLIDRLNKPLVTYSLEEELNVDNSDKLNIVCSTNSNTSALNATKTFNAATFFPKSLLNGCCTADFKQIEITDLKLSIPVYLVCSEYFATQNASLIKFFKSNLKSFFN